MKQLIIKQNDAGQRLDSFIRKTFPKLSLLSIQKYIRTKNIKVNDKKSENKYRLVLGDEIKLYINDEFLTHSNLKTDWLIAPSKINVVYEDENIIVINKPVGMVVHNTDDVSVDTLANRLKHYLYDKKEWDPEKENSFIPSLVNRIDRNTSGLVIAAKNATSLKILNEKIKNREIDKYYLCKVYGIIEPKDGILTGFLTKDTKKNKVLISKKPLNKDSQEVITQYHTISHDKTNSELEIKLITGRTHQIRAHMAYIGHPLIGERKYIGEQTNNDDGKFQSLVSYKIIFNFKTPAGILQYLNKKTIHI